MPGGLAANQEGRVLKRRVAASTLVVVVLGVLLHFAWEWSNESPVVAVFAATSESTWEHLKLAFWPALWLAPIQRWLYGRPPGWLMATAIRTLVPPAVIIGLFYGYTSILDTNYLALDIGTFVAAVLTGEYAGHSVIDRHLTRATRSGVLVLLAISVTAFSILTFHPPSWFLFEDPHATAGPGGAAASVRDVLSSDFRSRLVAGPRP
ncbi:MAG TPA: DUF6512 family protein [Gemmatimonadaceae bacterium]